MQITEAATDVIQRAYDAAARFNPAARVRIHLRGDTIETAFADAPEEGDIVLEHEGLTIFVAGDVGDGTIDVTDQHDRLIVRRT